MDSAQPVPVPRAATPAEPAAQPETAGPPPLSAAVLTGEVVVAVPRPPSRLRRVLAHGAGSVTALAMWGGLAAIAVVSGIVILIAQIPALIIFWPLLTVGLYAAGFGAGIIAALLTIWRPARRFAVGFLYGTLAAHVGLAVLVVAGIVVLSLIDLFA